MYEVTAYNDRGDVLYLNGPGLATVAMRLATAHDVTDYLAGLRSAYRWDNTRRRYVRNRVARMVVVRPDLSHEHWARRVDGTPVRVNMTAQEGSEGTSGNRHGSTHSPGHSG